MKFDHIALISRNIAETVDWYQKKLKAEVLYQDETWALTKVCGVKIAFVTKGQHPNHICFEIDEGYAKKHLSQKTFKLHRDNSSSCYVKDIDGNFIEFLKWPNQSG
tara:strand:- start:2193 stop:2510 length:318 start_codon:yes stop_codon:yes gene_type:complete